VVDVPGAVDVVEAPGVAPEADVLPAFKKLNPPAFVGAPEPVADVEGVLAAPVDAGVALLVPKPKLRGVVVGVDPRLNPGGLLAGVVLAVLKNDCVGFAVACVACVPAWFAPVKRVEVVVVG